jgi:hypothetical protein
VAVALEVVEPALADLGGTHRVLVVYRGGVRVVLVRVDQKNV